MYDSIIKVNKDFKSSVNLQYDLMNDSKILEYIPTSDLCDVIKSFLKNILSGKGVKSTILSGPYGKGKSYIILVIIYILSKNRNPKVIEELQNKIKKIDIELYQIIEGIIKQNLFYLPIIINNNEIDNLDQNFMLALKRALDINDLINIIPNNAFTECIKQIKLWKANSEISILNKCRNILNLDIDDLENKLSEYDADAYKMFCDLFECVNHGYKFNPLLGNDISISYQAVSHEIIKKGYKGIFTVFDEFGSFLENRNPDFLRNLNKIQAFAEKCNSSGERDLMYFCCITHKDLTLYQKDKIYNNEFERIGGRFKQLRFDRSSEENYQIIASSLVKGKNYDCFVNDVKLQEAKFFESCANSNLFDLNQLNFLIENTIPFNPITLYALIQISEKIGQNERTLFTFVSDDNINGFRYFIANKDKGFLNVDKIYDYFKEVIKDNPETQNFYYKVESLCRIELKNEYQQIFKTIAIMKIINDEIRFASTINNIAISLNIDLDDCTIFLNDLISKNLLKKNVIDSTIDFESVFDSSLNTKIDETIVNKVRKKDIASLLNKLNENHKYIVSNKYNFENKMTRYFYSLFIKYEDFKNLDNLSLSLTYNDYDAIIYNIVDMSEANLKDFKKNILKILPSYVGVRFAKEQINESIANKIWRLEACDILLESKNKLSDLSISNINNIISDLKTDINEYLDYYFKQCSTLANIKHTDDIFYSMLKETYSQTFIINNEQVNKRELSSPTMKSRNIVGDSFLKDLPKDFGTTSAEATIYNSFEKAIKDNESIFSNFESRFFSSDGKILGKDIVDYLKDKPIGMRKGVIPLFLTKVISHVNYSEVKSTKSTVLYNDSVEIELSTNNLSKLVENPDRYSIAYRSLGADKMFVIDVFSSKILKASYKNVTETLLDIVKYLKSTVSKLEPVILRSTFKDNILNLSDTEIKFKDIFLNPSLDSYSVVFEVLPKLLDVSIHKIPDEIENIFSSYKDKMKEFYKNEILFTKRLLSCENDESTLKSAFNARKIIHKYIDEIVLEEHNKKIYATFLEENYNDHEMINLLSLGIMKCTMEEWNSSKKILFEKSLSDFCNITNSNGKTKKTLNRELDKKIILNSLGLSLQSNILDVIEEYGQSLSTEDKINVIKSVLYKMEY